MGNDKKKTPVYQNSGKTYNRDKDQNNGKKYTDNKNNSKSKVAEIMEGILRKGYRTESKDTLRKELVSIEARNIAKNMKITNSQLRAFFNELKKLKQKYIDENEKNVDKLHIELLILKSKLEYKKGGKKITNEFSEFMEKNIDIVIKENTIQSYKDFLVFFETVLGYMYGLGGVNNR
jgi:CRISPR type III-A/MTUBE-associated protein Csm2